MPPTWLARWAPVAGTEAGASDLTTHSAVGPGLPHQMLNPWAKSPPLEVWGTFLEDSNAMCAALAPGSGYRGLLQPRTKVGMTQEPRWV